MSAAPAGLIIGASGAIGSALVSQLVPDHEAGRLRLIAATRKDDVAQSLRERGIEVRGLCLVVVGLRQIRRDSDANDEAELALCR